MPSVSCQPTSDTTGFVTRASTARDLRRWLGAFWAGAGPDAPAGNPARERVLPTGQAHLVIRLAGPPLRLYDSELDGLGRPIGDCLVGGPREAAYLRALDPGSVSVGVELLPGTVPALFGVPAWQLAGAHWSLTDLWGADALRLREQLLETRDAHRRIEILEQVLLGRLQSARKLHPAIAFGLSELARGSGVSRIVREAGYSHRRFLSLFRDAAGLTPTTWSRVQRFRRAVLGLHAGAGPASVAAAEFADQPHLTREFRRIAGITPARYRGLKPAQPNHVPVIG
jgi:AraC-like DNA-binding protein